MRLKQALEVSVEIDVDGEIVLVQYNEVLDEDVPVYLTIDQFWLIEKWIKENYLEINEIWNGGVDDGES